MAGSRALVDRAPTRGRPALGQAEQITARIVDAAWAVLLESGPELFALDRVAAAAHASKQTIYTRFAGKAELLESVLAARTGLLFADFDDAAQSGDIETVIAEITRRSVGSLSAPEALMLERLIDWSDRTRPEASTREKVYRDMLARLRGCLERAVALDQVAIADLDSAARFWLEGLIGHVRGLSRHDESLAHWPETYARYFLRAISLGPPARIALLGGLCDPQAEVAGDAGGGGVPSPPRKVGGGEGCI